MFCTDITILLCYSHISQFIPALPNDVCVLFEWIISVFIVPAQGPTLLPLQWVPVTHSMEVKCLECEILSNAKV
jgi:hypothetical protein